MRYTLGSDVLCLEERLPQRVRAADCRADLGMSRFGAPTSRSSRGAERVELRNADPDLMRGIRKNLPGITRRILTLPSKVVFAGICLELVRHAGKKEGLC